jgi:glycerophosphoryl diester phosphodiesterase
VLLPSHVTNYRRWWNNSWLEVEEGGQRHAGRWTTADEERLHALVDHAHRQGYWIRFYTLDGFAMGEDQGWGASYNFGSLAAAQKRWKAALDAGVDMIATDQYEALGAFMRKQSR